jgi:hypothetical protein
MMLTLSLISFSYGQNWGNFKDVNKITFYEFFRAGFLVNSSSQIPLIGKISRISRNPSYLTSHDLLIVHLISNYYPKVNEKMTIFEIPRSIPGYGNYVENLGIAKILKSSHKQCLAEIIYAIHQIKRGDLVSPFLVEQSRFQYEKNYVQKTKLTHIRGKIVSGIYTSPVTFYSGVNQLVIINVGTKEGALLGQQFLIKRPLNSNRLSIFPTIGILKIVQLGKNYSIAKILNAKIPIQKGFMVKCRK